MSTVLHGQNNLSLYQFYRTFLSSINKFGGLGETRTRKHCMRGVLSALCIPIPPLGPSSHKICGPLFLILLSYT